MKKRFLFFLLLIGFGMRATSQTPMQPKSVPSPIAAGLGMYGQIPVNHFNGLPSIDIPLHTLTEQGVSIPISLSYHASGVRPDHHPGWVGLGWSLNAGGVITRVVNGDPDELKLPNANTIAPEYENQKSYFLNYGALAASNWDQSSRLDVLIEDGIYTSPVYGTEIGLIPAPDEFIFNFNGFTGSFFMNHKGEWKVRSSNGKAIKIETMEMQEAYQLYTSVDMPPITLARIIYKFVLIAPDGVAYTFGGATKSIEFSRNAGKSDESFRQVVPTSWFLTNIKLASGDEINLTYESEGYAVVMSEVWNNSYYNDGRIGRTNSGPGNYSLETLINPSYLSEISTANQKITFSRSISTELQYPALDDKIFNVGSQSFQDIGSEGSKWYKLDHITVTDNVSGRDIRKFSFNYTNQLSSRLMLLDVREVDPNSSKAKNPHVFHYYDDPNIELPLYISRKLDHWGFFNNRNFFDGKPGNYQYRVSDSLAYFNARESDSTYLKEGSLRRIVYPTGGETEFIYEANRYSYIAHTYNTNPAFQVQKIGSNGHKKVAGGLRVKKIISRSENSESLTREFLYTDDDSFNSSTGTNDALISSSGILGGLPVYAEDYSEYSIYSQYCYNAFTSFISCISPPGYWIIKNNSIQPLSFTQGSHVTYSKVKERFSDGSYKVYRYSNHDSVAYRNAEPIRARYIGAGSKVNIPFNDMSYYRGKLLNEKTYSSSAKLLQNINREYNSASNPDDVIRMANIHHTPAPGYTQIVAYLKYIHEPYLKKETVDDYSQSGNSYTRSIREYAYVDSTMALKTEKTLQSDNSYLVTNYRYPLDRSALSPAFGGGHLQTLNEMISRNIISPVIEKEVYRQFVSDGPLSFVKRESTIYDRFTFGGINRYLPHSVMTNWEGSGLDNLEARFHSYDKRGNVLTFSKNDGPKTSYIWGNNDTQPIAQIEHAKSGEVYHENFENSAHPGAGTDSVHTGSRALHQNTFDLSWTKPSGSTRSYVHSYWYRSGGQWKFSLPEPYNGPLTLSKGTAYDDISVYPSDALMTTYTYAPLIGLTSQIDPKGQTTYYEYDDFHRLLNIRDQNSNIVKNYSYNYANTGTAPPVTSYQNGQQSAPFTRNNCPSGQQGTPVTYVVGAGRYSSLISPADADQKALADIAANGQRNANLLGGCAVTQPGSGPYYNVADSASRTRASCAVGQTGSTVTYTVAAGTYSSTVSQAAANALARADIQANAQRHADSLGTCSLSTNPNLRYNAAYTATAVKENCPVGMVGTPESYTVADSVFSAPTQTEANQLAIDHAATQAQIRANSLGSCVTAPPVTFTFNITSAYDSVFDVIFNYAAGGSSHYTFYTQTNLSIQVPGEGLGSITIIDKSYLASTSTYNFSLNGTTQSGSGTVSFNSISYDSPISLNIVRTSAYYFHSAQRSKTARTVCPTGQTGGWVNYVVPAGRYSSTVSQADANQMAVDDANANAQAHANANGVCTPNVSLNYITPATGTTHISILSEGVSNYYPVSGSGTISNLPASPTSIRIYPPEMSNATFSYAINGQAPDQVDSTSAVFSLTMGPGMTLSVTAQQTFWNSDLSVTKTKNDCPGDNMQGSAEVYMVYANTYSSHISQADADAKAQAQADANAQNHTNMIGYCIPVFRNAVQSVSLSRNNCPSGQGTTPVTYTVAAATYTSQYSQMDADQQALDDIAANAQAYANQHGTCSVVYYSAATSRTLTRNNCAPNNTGGAYTYSLYGGRYSSTISQADADQQAQADLDANAQARANQYGTCTPPVTYHSAQMSVTRTKNDCTSGTGTSVTYISHWGKHTSTVSQAAANALAQADLDANAQNYANTTGTCATVLNYSVPDVGVTIYWMNSTTNTSGSAELTGNGSIALPLGSISLIVLVHDDYGFYAHILNGYTYPVTGSYSEFGPMLLSTNTLTITEY
ncbi:MAG: hypothetical protein EOP51_03850 [Sphingobacteriales bacterium]|nr:MAG: hypothetical protein EOP51_03850 [Sphingobacteriales bacterium]